MSIVLWCGNIVAQCKRAKSVFDMDRLLRLCEYQIEGREDCRDEIRRRTALIYRNIAKYREQCLDVDSLLHLSQCALKAPIDGENDRSWGSKFDDRFATYDSLSRSLSRSRR